MSIKIIVLIVLGTALILFSAWERMGRGVNARAWVDSPGARALHLALFVRPGLGLALLGLGLIDPLEDVPVLSSVIALVAIIGTVMLVWGILRLPIPRWWVPGFARDRLVKDRALDGGR